MKKVLSFFILMLLPMVAGAEPVLIGGIYYNFISKGGVIGAEVTNKTGGTYGGRSSYSGSLVIPASVTCEGAEYSVTSIGEYAFRDCSSLTSVTIPNSVTSIGDWAFRECSGLTSVTIPSSVTSIGVYAFRDCSGLTSVTIPNSVTSIGYDAFLGCSSLNSVKVPVTDYSTFCTNMALGCIWSRIGTPVQLIDTEGKEITEYIVPDGVTSIESSAFTNCTGLTSVTIPNSMTSIGDWAFWGCSGLTSVTIPSSVTSIGYCAFRGCSGLTSITIPNSVTSIGESAFELCSSLTSVTIGGGVSSIGGGAFSGCTSLMSVKSYIKEPFNISRFTEETYRNGTLYVPAGTKDLYIRFDGWREFLKIEEMTAEPAPNGQCATPRIYVMGKKFVYECETPGAEFESILSTEEEKSKGNEFVMENKTIKYTLTVYATAEGYDRSQPATISFVIDRSDVNQDGTVDVADIATIITEMASRSRTEAPLP